VAPYVPPLAWVQLFCICQSDSSEYVAYEPDTDDEVTMHACSFVFDFLWIY
jgi:hypothetical protein